MIAKTHITITQQLMIKELWKNILTVREKYVKKNTSTRLLSLNLLEGCREIFSIFL
jgi:hypothetical protein